MKRSALPDQTGGAACVFSVLCSAAYNALDSRVARVGFRSVESPKIMTVSCFRKLDGKTKARNLTGGPDLRSSVSLD